MSKKEKKQFITKDIFYSSIKGAFTKLSPKYMIKNPVMFVVEVGFILCTILVFFPHLFHDEGSNLSLYNAIVAIILFVTLLFANFAESVAEGRGKAQADTLKKTKKDDEIIALVEYEKKIKNGSAIEQNRVIKEIYTFNNKELRKTPENLIMNLMKKKEDKQGDLFDD